MGRFDLADDSPDAFAYFVDWLYLWKQEGGKDISDGEEAPRWPIVHATKAWILADKLLSGDFAKFALAQFILSITFDADKNRRETGRAMTIVFENTMSESALYKFASEWVAWCYQEDFEVVKEFKSKSIPKDNRVSETPSTYDFDHWNKQCSSTSPSNCSHRMVGILPPTLKKRHRWRQEVKSRVRLSIEWGRPLAFPSSILFLHMVCLHCRYSSCIQSKTNFNLVVACLCHAKRVYRFANRRAPWSHTNSYGQLQSFRFCTGCGTLALLRLRVLHLYCPLSARGSVFRYRIYVRWSALGIVCTFDFGRSLRSDG
jgi:hypothetical protein